MSVLGTRDNQPVEVKCSIAKLEVQTRKYTIQLRYQAIVLMRMDACTTHISPF